MNDKEHSEVQPSEQDVKAPLASQQSQDASRKAVYEFHDRKLEEFQKHVDERGEQVFAHLGFALYHSLPDEQVQAHREKLGFEPKDALDFYNQGCMMAGREQFEPAAKAFKKAVELNPDCPEAHYNLALALERMGQTAKARKAWESYLEQFAEAPDGAEVKEHLAELSDA